MKTIVENVNFLQCKFCGHILESADDFDLDNINYGFWCNICDGYNYIGPEKHKFELILEDKNKKEITKYSSKIALNKRLSPLRYPGGKSKLLNYLYSKIQSSKTDTLVGAFAGGASLELALLDAGIVKKLIINDLDIGIYSLFSIIKNDPYSLIHRIKEIQPTHKDFFFNQKIIKNNYKDCSSIDAAWACLVVNRLAYSGIYKANPLGGKNGTTSKLLSRWNPKELIKRINKINKISSKITVLNMDAIKLIEEVYWEDSATIFVDPPYYKQGKNLYPCYFSEDDHIRLAVLLDSLYHGCPGADIILCYDNTDFIKNLYLYPNLNNINRIYSI